MPTESTPATAQVEPRSTPSSLCRYAVYLIPSGPWSSLGERWLGRNAATGECIARGCGDDNAQIDTWTQAPRLYGLHATLKPPFRLAHGSTFSDLDESLRALAQSMSAFQIPLQLTRLRGFLAWCVAGEMPAALTRLANACVADLDRFRQPPSAEETARRKHADLTPAELQNLQRWGYPYVFDTFVFHVTLTGRLDEASAGMAQAVLNRLALGNEARALRRGAEMPVNDIGLFVQAAPGQPFVMTRRYGFDGSVDHGSAVAGASAQEVE